MTFFTEDHRISFITPFESKQWLIESERKLKPAVNNWRVVREYYSNGRRRVRCSVVFSYYVIQFRKEIKSWHDRKVRKWNNSFFVILFSDELRSISFQHYTWQIQRRENMLSIWICRNVFQSVTRSVTNAVIPTS